MDSVSWSSIEWQAPKIELSVFRQPGKVCKELTPVEVAFFLEMPYKRILSCVLQQLTQAGFLAVRSRNPLEVDVLDYAAADFDDLEPFEQAMVMAAKDDGLFSKREMEEILEQVVASVRKKSWDCDIEATKQYWRARIDTVWNERQRQGHPGRDEDERAPVLSRHYGWHHWYFLGHNYTDYDHTFRAGPLRALF